MDTIILHSLILIGYGAASGIYLRHFWTRQAKSGSFATAALLLGLVCHSVFLVNRAVESAHAPFVGLHESLSFFAWLIAIVYLTLETRFRDRSLGVFILPLILVTQAASTMLMEPVDPLPPLLQSAWFNFHVAASFLAYAAFFFSFITGLLYVLQMYYIHHRQFRAGFLPTSRAGYARCDESQGDADWLRVSYGRYCHWYLVGGNGIQIHCPVAERSEGAERDADLDHIQCSIDYPVCRWMAGRTRRRNLHGGLRVGVAGLARRRVVDRRAHL